VGPDRSGTGSSGVRFLAAGAVGLVAGLYLAFLGLALGSALGDMLGAGEYGLVLIGFGGLLGLVGGLAIGGRVAAGGHRQGDGGHRVGMSLAAPASVLIGVYASDEFGFPWGAGVGIGVALWFVWVRLARPRESGD